MSTTLGSVLVRIGGDIGGLQKAYADAKRETQALAQGLERAGDAFTKNVTLPVLAAGTAAVKFAGDFGTSFAQIQGLVGVAAGEVAGFREELVALGPEVRKRPTELAEALFFVTSAGLEGQAALDALAASARASTAGLGTTASVADAVTSAVNSYGEANLAASRATDVLTATVREGKLEAAALAPQLGRLLPVAAELGVSFDQVGAALSVFSRSTGSAELSATQLNGILSKLLGPTQAGRDALAALGLSADGLRTSIRENGLLETLVELREKVDASGGNAGEVFKAIFEEINAVNGVLQLTGDNAERARDIFASLAGSAGATDAAFAAVADTFGGKVAGSLASIEGLAIRVGVAYQRVLAPAVETAGRLATQAADAFAALPASTQDTLVKVTLLAAAIGPLLGVLAAVVSAVPFVAAGFAAIGTTATAALGPIGLVAAGVAALALAYDDYTRSARETVAASGAAAGAFDRLGASLPTLRDLLSGAADGAGIVTRALSRLRLQTRAVGVAIEAELVRRIADVLGALRRFVPGVEGAYLVLRELQGSAYVDLAQIRGELNATSEEARRFGEALRANLGPISGRLGPLSDLIPDPTPPTPPPVQPVAPASLPTAPRQAAAAAGDAVRTAAAAVRTVADVTKELDRALAAIRVRFQEGLVTPAGQAAERASAIERALSAALALPGGEGAARGLAERLKEAQRTAATLGLDEALANVQARLEGGVIAPLDAVRERLGLVESAYTSALESGAPEAAVRGLRLRVLELQTALVDLDRAAGLDALLTVFNRASTQAEILRESIAQVPPLRAAEGLDATERATVSLIRSAPRLSEALSLAYGSVQEAVVSLARTTRRFADDLADGVLALVPDLFAVDSGRARLELEAFAEGAAATRERLQEAFEEGRIGAAELELSLVELEERRAQFERGLPTVGNAFRNLAQSARQAVASIIADIGRAIVRALVLRGILGALNIVAPGAGAALGGVLSAAGAGFGKQQVQVSFGNARAQSGGLFIPATATAQQAEAGTLALVRTGQIPA